MKICIQKSEKRAEMSAGGHGGFISLDLRSRFRRPPRTVSPLVDNEILFLLAYQLLAICSHWSDDLLPAPGRWRLSIFSFKIQDSKQDKSPDYGRTFAGVFGNAMLDTIVLCGHMEIS